MMRLNAISVFLLVTIMHVNASSVAQQVTIKGKEAMSIAQVFREIRMQTGYTVLWKPEMLEAGKTIHVQFINTPVKKVLEACIAPQGLTYIVKGRAIVIRERDQKKDVRGRWRQNEQLPSQADTVRVSGNVIDSLGTPLIGATVSIVGTNKSGQTDNDGAFLLTDVAADATMQVSYVGYETRRVPVSHNPQGLTIILTESNALEEVVVVGYGVQKRGEITSAIASVQAENFTEGLIRDASELIKGKIAGLSISNGSGDPSARSTVSLRGISSLQGGTEPLILINGIPGEFNTLSPQDILSVDVLKDASAAAIYGTRGANGVILITTKSGGRNMDNTISYNSYYSTSQFNRTADFVNAKQYRDLIDRGLLAAESDEGYSTDWLDAISNDAFTHNHSLAYRGGNAKSNYAGSVNYMNQGGVFEKSNNEELRLSIDMNHAMFDDKLLLNMNVVKGFQKYGALGNGTSFNPEIYRQALTRNPTDRIYDDEGGWQERNKNFYTNPVAMIKETEGLVDNDWTRLTGNITVNMMENWNAKLTVATDRRNEGGGYSETKKHFSNTRDGRNGFASRFDRKSTTNFLELTSTYSISGDNHRLSALGGYSYQYENNNGGDESNFDFPSDSYSYNNLATGEALLRGLATLNSYQNENKLIGFFGRLSYGFGNRYHLLASIRQEGSSKFGVNNKWGTFPAVSVGWTISEEHFMERMTYLDNLKIRAGYGITGVIPRESYLSQTLLTYENYFLNQGNWVQGLVPVSNPNPDLRWEKSKEVNVGVDFSFLNGRISGAVDLYHKKTEDMLWDYTVPTPPYLYNTIKANVGEMENKGIEILVDAYPIRNKRFEWNSVVTFSKNANKLISLSNDLFEISGDFFNTGVTGSPIQTYTHRLEVGKPVGSFFGLKSVDVDEDGIWIIETEGGEKKSIADATSDSDKQYLGNGVPNYHGGWTNTFRYGNFDLSLVLTGAFDFQILNFQRMFYENPTVANEYNVLNSAFEEVYGKALLSSSQAYVSHYIENGDYVKVENLTIGYNLVSNGNSIFKNVRLYASGSNLLTITRYKGLDPEINRWDPLTSGNDPRDKFPTYRSIAIGLNVTF